MRKTITIFILGAVSLVGCGSKTDANEKNFGAALTQFFDKKGELCLRLNKWPVDVTEMDIRLQKNSPTGVANQMATLEALGLVSGADAEIDQVGMFDNKPTGYKFKVKRYTLTEAGNKFYREKEVDSIGLGGTKKIMQGDVCYGKKALGKIVKWEGPIKLGEYQEAGVTYTYKIDNLADWAKKSEFGASFPYAKRIIDDAGAKESQHSVKLTSQGWKAKGLD